MYRCTRKGTIHVHVLVVHVHGECSVRLPIGIEILRCVILGRLLVEHVDKSHTLDNYAPALHSGVTALYMEKLPFQSRR